MKDFSSWPFLCLCVLCDTHARLLFEKASEQESCLFLLIRPGKVLPGNAAFIETVSYPSQMLSDFMLISTCVLSILFPRLSPIYSVCDTDLSYHHLPYLKVRMTSVIDWLIDWIASSDFCTRAFNHCLFSLIKPRASSSGEKALFFKDPARNGRNGKTTDEHYCKSAVNSWNYVNWCTGFKSALRIK